VYSVVGGCSVAGEEWENTMVGLRATRFFLRHENRMRQLLEQFFFLVVPYNCF
jgi:hypothetical protein